MNISIRYATIRKKRSMMTLPTVLHALQDCFIRKLQSERAEKTLSVILLIMRSDFFEFVRNHGIQYVCNIGVLRGVK